MYRLILRLLSQDVPGENSGMGHGEDTLVSLMRTLSARIVVEDKPSISLGHFSRFISFQLFFSWNEPVRQNQAHSWNQNFMKWPGWHSLVHTPPELTVS